jgi:hypothetical protein
MTEPYGRNNSFWSFIFGIYLEFGAWNLEFI